VASTLLNRGRLGVTAVSRLSAVSRNNTLAAVLLLVQHNLVLSNGESLLGTGEEELYEFDVQECLMRLRWSKILSLTEEKLGPVVRCMFVSWGELMIGGGSR
jgi:DNA-directed RNA polymerase III subunit RPC3